MQPSATDGVEWSVCWSYVVYPTHLQSWGIWAIYVTLILLLIFISPTKTAEPIEKAFGG